MIAARRAPPADIRRHAEPAMRGWLIAMVAAMACHLVLSLAYAERVWTTSLGIGGAIAVTLAFCTAQLRHAQPGMRWRRSVLTVALACWLLAYAAIAWLQHVYPTGGRAHFDQLFYSLRLVPYFVILARSGDDDEGPLYRAIDFAQALLLGALILWLLYPTLHLGPLATAEMIDDRTMRYHDIGNIGVAVLAILAVPAQIASAKRRFTVALATLLTSYAALSLAVNHLAIGWPHPPGHAAYLIGDVPFLLFLLAYARGGRKQTAPHRPVLLSLLMPTAFCAAAILVAFAIGTWHAALAAGAALLLMGYRAALLQNDLARLERFVAGLVDHLPDAVCVVDTDGTVVRANAAADRLFGAAVLGQPFEALRTRLGRTSEQDATIETPSRQTFVLANATLGSGETLVRLTDITPLRLMERERQDVLQLLGHDIRSPYASILTLLDHHGADDDWTQRLRRHARQGLAIADDFTRLARAREATLACEPVDLLDVMAEAKDQAWSAAHVCGIMLAGPNGDLEDSLWIDGDRGLLTRAVYNLLDNAVRFAPDGSTINCAVTMRGGRIHVTVAGEGPELPPDRRADPFARFGGRDDRIGLGLALVHVAGMRHGGTANYRRDGDRNVFAIELPHAPA